MKSSFLRIAMPLYALVIAAIVAGTFHARRAALETYGTEQAEADWQTWVREARRQESEGPVRRRAPESARPPAAVLMGEYFGTCLTGAILMGSALYWSFAGLTYGAFSRTFEPLPDQDDGTNRPGLGR
ncbi:MAG: hypothetical protein FJ297_13615 [Planctomycetes bacterium]|nr:hypothetical protein [Planctomycetota bacterium]